MMMPELVQMLSSVSHPGVVAGIATESKQHRTQRGARQGVQQRPHHGAPACPTAA
jgi:hypothetical protein